jgi:hypothetical protein
MTTFRVHLARGDRVLTEGIIDKNACYVFRHGYCAELAYAVHERTGGLLAQVEADGIAGTRHAGVVLGEAAKRFAKQETEQVIPPNLLHDCTVVDIEGLHEWDAWFERWVGPGMRLSLAAAGDLDEPHRMDECRARTFVEPVLALAGVTCA